MKDKVVLITGAAKRVGACIAKNLHSQGMRVIIHYRASESSAKTLVNELNTIRKNSAACLKAELNNNTKANSGQATSFLPISPSLSLAGLFAAFIKSVGNRIKLFLKGRIVQFLKGRK